MKNNDISYHASVSCQTSCKMARFPHIVIHRQVADTCQIDEEASGMTDIRETIDAIYRVHSRHVFATLIRLLGDFDVAEEALHAAFKAALEQWPRDGIPTNPRAWLVSTGRFKAIDGLRRRARFQPLPEDIEEHLAAQEDEEDGPDGEGLEDDRLRLIFTCCHPALS